MRQQYILKNGIPRTVRVSSNGNLVTAGGELIARAGESVPLLYASEPEAWEAQAKIEAACKHSWNILSHEERICHRCGAVEFCPDI